MKKVCLLFVVFFTCLCTLTLAIDFPDVSQYGSCIYCGMDRQKFAHSRMIINYTDGSNAGFCSLHCAALDLANQIDKTPETIMVGDYKTKILIDAEDATWVLGGSVKGVMSKRPKWAFSRQAEAEKFIGEYGGEIIAFENAMKATYEDMYQDTKMIRNKRQEMKKMKMKQPNSLKR